MVHLSGTTARQTALDLYNLFPDKTREWLEKVVMENEAKGKETASRPDGTSHIRRTANWLY
jgi:hypothetical protein